jgi:antitoxin component of RelBE/YafQ-DinJ toxin-antitoxin module
MTHQINFRLPDETKAKVDSAMDDLGVNLTAFMRLAVTYYLKKLEKED